MADMTVNSTRTLQMLATFNGVATTMDTASFTLFNPNQLPVIGPVGVASVSTGVYQYALPIGLITLPGTWVQTWYVQRGTQSFQSSAQFTVGL